MIQDFDNRGTNENPLDSIEDKPDDTIARPRGRPKLTNNEKGNYTLSERALAKRQVTNLRDGSTSRILSQLSSCYNCMIRNQCSIFPTLNEDHKRTGCTDIRQYFLMQLKDLGNPIAHTIKKVAELETLLAKQQIKDGVAGDISPQYVKLTELYVKLMDLSHKMGISAEGFQDRRTMEATINGDVVINLETKKEEPEATNGNPEVQP